MPDETPQPPTQPEAPKPEPTPAAAPAAAVPKKELTPEEKKAKQKAALKRTGLVLGIVYLVVLLLIVLYGAFFATKELTLFNFLPVSQVGFSNAMMTLFNVLFGLLVFGALVVALTGLLKSLLIKKEEVEKKKKASRLAMWGGIGFLILAILWLVAIWFLGPRLVVSEVFESPIVTVPEDTIGLTAPITITFDASQIPIDTGTYRILSYSWDFGDGSAGTGESISHRYLQKDADGIYTVFLDVTYMDLKSGDEFEYSASKEISIENELTAASFTASPDSGDIPLKVKFDATASYDPDGEIVLYEWDFDGDGRFDDAEGVEAEYTFTQEGDFDVTLRVTDNSGEFNTVTKTIEAGSVGGLRAVIGSELAEGESYFVGEKYEFSGELSQIESGNITKYSWDFGDGTTLSSRTASHSYEEAGQYDLTLTVSDAFGNSDQDILEITVVEEGEAPTPVIETIPELTAGVVSGTVPFTVVFDGSSSIDPDDDIVEYEWDFENDGVIDETGDTATYTYQDVGSYEARLVVTDSVGNVEETLVTVEVAEQGVVAKLTVSASNGEVPLTVKFDASASTYKEGNIVSYEYDFGDGSDVYIGGSSLTYKYTQVGNFTASVTVIGDDGKRDEASVQIVVRPVSLTACFTVNTDSGSAPLFIAVDPSCSQGTIGSYQWSFGDGEISYDRKPETHVYDEVGTYTITLEITSDDGIVDSFEQSVTVK